MEVQAWSLEMIFSLERRLQDAERTLAGWLRGDGTVELFQSGAGLSRKQTGAQSECLLMWFDCS